MAAGDQLKRSAAADAVDARTPEASKALDELLSRPWIVVHRALPIWPASMIAMRPVRIADRVTRLPLQDPDSRLFAGLLV